MTLIIENVRSTEGGPIEILVSDGLIDSIAPSLAPPDGAGRFDADGMLALPALVDGHMHLDKTLTGLPFVPHIEGSTVAERIAADKRLRRTVTMPAEERGGRLIERIAALGTVAVRSHVDIDSEVQLKGLEAVLSLKESHGHLVEIQIVAFPQSGILKDPGTEALLESALRLGGDLIGGIDPAGIDGDIAGHLDLVFGLAEKYGKGIDLHLHDRGLLGAFELREIAMRASVLGMQGKVAVSHAFCLGELPPEDFFQTVEALAKGGVSIMTTAPGPVPMPPVKPLREAGVRVFCGSDNIRDAWSPFGNGDMLERAGILCDRQDYRRDSDLEMAFSLVAQSPAEVIGMRSGLKPGAPANILLVRAGSIAEAVASRPYGRTVFRQGRMVACNGALVQ